LHRSTAKWERRGPDPARANAKNESPSRLLPAWGVLKGSRCYARPMRQGQARTFQNQLPSTLIQQGPTPYAYFKKQIVPLSEAKIGVMTHAFNYGTGVFEGIRGNWNESHEQLYVFRIRDHFDRLRKSCKIMQIDLPYDNEELVSLLTKVGEMADFHEDVYVRPLAYKSSEVLGVRLHDLEDDLLIFATPFGPYLDMDKGIRCQTSSWRRVADTGIPARAKVTGLYANSALAKTEAQLNGFDEAIMLDERGHISEGSGENIFVIMDGKIITPPPSTRRVPMKFCQMIAG